MAKFCCNCGQPLPEGAKFCTDCGTPAAFDATAGKPEETEKISEERIKVEKPEEQEPAKEPRTVFSSRENINGFAEEKTDYESYRNAFGQDKYVPDKTIMDKYFRYDNRLNRWPYFCRTIILSIVIGILSSMVTLGNPAIMGYLSLAATTPLGIRRWHDLGKSGWWVLTEFIPVIGFVAGLYSLFAKGDEGANEYGPDPLG